MCSIAGTAPTRDGRTGTLHHIAESYSKLSPNSSHHTSAGSHASKHCTAASDPIEKLAHLEPISCYDTLNASSSSTGQTHITSTYDHRTLKTGLPVRSALLKQCTGGLVVRWVTTSESRLLYVFFWSFFASPGTSVATLCALSLRPVDETFLLLQPL